MKLSEIIKILDAEVPFCEDKHLELEILGAGAADLMDDVLAAAAKNGVILTGQVSVEVVQFCNMAKAVAIVFVRGKKSDSEIIDVAKKYEIPILLTKYSLFVACGRLYMNGLRGLDGSW